MMARPSLLYIALFILFNVLVTAINNRQRAPFDAILAGELSEDELTQRTLQGILPAAPAIPERGDFNMPLGLNSLSNVAPLSHSLRFRRRGEEFPLSRAEEQDEEEARTASAKEERFSHMEAEDQWTAEHTARLENAGKTLADAGIDSVRDGAKQFAEAAAKHKEEILATASQRKDDINNAMVSSKAKIQDAYNEAIDPALDKMKAAADDAGDRVGGVARRVGTRAAEGAKELGKEALKVGQKVGKKTVELAKTAWAHREEYAAKAKDLAKKGAKAAKEAAAFAAQHKEELKAISSALKMKLNAASLGGKPEASMTDQEYCTGCQISLSSVIEHTTAESSTEEIIFAIHSACNNQPAVMREGCAALIRLDALAADQLTASRDAPFVCEMLGMCYQGILDPSPAPPPPDKADAEAAAAS